MRARQTGFRAPAGVWVAAAVLAAAASSAPAGTWFAVAPDGLGGANTDALPRAPQVVLDWRDDAGLALTVNIAGLELALEHTKDGRFVIVDWPSAAFAGEIGTPALPVLRRLFVAPDGAAIELSVKEGRATLVELAAAGFADPVIPMQPPLDMIPGARKRARFHCSDAVYAVDELLPRQRVAISELGVVRGRHVHLLEVRPVAYNPARGTLTVWPHLEIGIRFEGGRGMEGLRPWPPLDAVVLNPQPPRPIDSNSGNYLIIVADEEFSAVVPTLAAARTARGFDVSTHWVSPGTSNTEIRAYIQSLWETPAAPDYLLLVGDTDTIPHWIGGGTRHAVTDLPYACMDGEADWLPDMALGRFSARTAAELQAMVDKTLCVEAGVFPDPDYVRRAALVATGDMSSGGEETHDWVVEHYLDPNEFESTKIYARLGGDTTHIASAVNNGCLFAAYFGHSITGGWWSPAFTQDDVRNLDNAGLYGLVFGFSCNTAQYSVDECFGETWIRVADRGAAAYLSASTLIYYQQSPWHEAQNLEKFYFQSFFEDNIWEVGPAWQAALQRFLAYYGAEPPPTRDYFEMMVLLGDPALRLPGAGFTLSADPVSQTLCSPPEDQVEYTIEVARTGDFNQPVTLTASGQPAGAQVNFSFNSLVPPFTTVMTVSDVAGGSPGVYLIEITGTAVPAQRSVCVDLHLATGAPGEVRLASPPDGAVEVARDPVLAWEPASQAAEYHVQIATDPRFLHVAYGATAGGPSHRVTTNLNAGTLHYWHVRAANGCGHGDFSPAFSFTTIDQPEYFTQQFAGYDFFDLDNFTVEFVPDGSDHFYAMCGQPISRLPTDPTGGTVLPLGDNTSEQVTPSSLISIYREWFARFYVNSNGNITFVSGDGTRQESLEAHFGQPRVAAVFDDLNPAAGGTVSYRDLPEDRIAVTWEDVPEWGTENSNTFQIELLYNGEVHVSWLTVDSDDSVAGLSEGAGLPEDYVPTDLSSAGGCRLPFGNGDLNCDGIVDALDIDLFVLALTDPAQYAFEHPDCAAMLGDLNCDGDLDAFDIDPFVICLTTGNCNCP